MFKIVLAGLLAKISRTDWKRKRIPDKLVVYVLLAGMPGLYIFPEIDLLQRCVGVFAVSTPLLLIAVMVSGAIGGGDVKLMAAGGFLLGIYNIWRAFIMGILIAGIFVSYQLMTGKMNRKTEIALGPFLCLGMFLVLLEI